MIELKHIHKYYNAGSVNEMCLFEDFNLTIQDGEFVSIVGSNGSGKTSLLNIICGSIGVDGGQIMIGGKDITHQKDYLRHRRIGRVYQDPAKGTCGHMKKSREDYYKELLLPLGLGLEDKMHTQVGSLSGGQRQAVALLMATMTPIEMLILDEHTAALDPKTAEIIMELTGKIVAEKKLTTMMVTHNLRYAVEYGDRLLMMHQGQAILDQSGKKIRYAGIHSGRQL